MIEVTTDSKSTYRFLKEQMIKDVERDLRDRKLSKDYKRAAIRYAVKEIGDYNKALGLAQTDGVKKAWLIV